MKTIEQINEAFGHFSLDAMINQQMIQSADNALVRKQACIHALESAFAAGALAWAFDFEHPAREDFESRLAQIVSQQDQAFAEARDKHK